MNHTQPPSPSRSLESPFGGPLGEMLLILLVFFAIAGDAVPHVNEPHYLCRLKHFWNPDWCRGDLFLDSPEAHGLFVWLFGWVTRWLTLTQTAWLGRILAWSFLAFAWHRLSWHVLPKPLVSVLTAAMWVALTELLHLAGEWVVGGVEAKCFAYGFVLLALADLIDNRWNRAWICLGAASAFHALVGGWSVIVCGGIWLWNAFRSTDTNQSLLRSFASMLPGLLTGGLLALVGVIPALALTWNQAPEVVAEANRIYVFERLSHHLALLSLPLGEAALRIGRHALLILALLTLIRLNRQSQHDSARAGLRIVTLYAWGAVALAALGFTIELATLNHPLAAASLLRYYWFRLTDVAVPLAVAFQAVTLIVTGFSERRTWALWALAAAIGLCGCHIALRTAHRFIYPAPPADLRMDDYAAWVDVCDWISENTPPDARFLTPRLSQTFKWRTGRPEVATRKDIPQDAASMVAWFDRLEDIFYWQLDEGMEPLGHVGELGTARAVEMARKYGARYILSDRDHPLALPPVYPTREHPNDEYVVYEIKD